MAPQTSDHRHGYETAGANDPERFSKKYDGEEKKAQADLKRVREKARKKAAQIENKQGKTGRGLATGRRR